jgi:hypothetical protein
MERRSRLSRREVLMGAAGLGLLAGCGRLPGQAQPSPVRVARIGYLGTRPTLVDAFRQGLHDFGYLEGETFIIEWRGSRQPDFGDFDC